MIVIQLLVFIKYFIGYFIISFITHKCRRLFINFLCDLHRLQYTTHFWTTSTITTVLVVSSKAKSII